MLRLWSEEQYNKGRKLRKVDLGPESEGSQELDHHIIRMEDYMVSSQVSDHL